MFLPDQQSAENLISLLAKFLLLSELKVNRENGSNVAGSKKILSREVSWGYNYNRWGICFLIIMKNLII